MLLRGRQRVVVSGCVVLSLGGFVFCGIVYAFCVEFCPFVLVSCSFQPSAVAFELITSCCFMLFAGKFR